MMKLARLFVALLLVAFVCGGATRATAQTTPAQEATEEVANLLERWQQAKTVEERISVGEQLIALESRAGVWPKGADRPAAKADVHFFLGSVYVERAEGVRAENLEKAIAHLESAMTLWTRETEPQN